MLPKIVIRNDLRTPEIPNFPWVSMITDPLVRALARLKSDGYSPVMLEPLF